ICIRSLLRQSLEILMNTETIKVRLGELYHQDFYLWLETTAKQIKEGDLEQIDFKNLLEEIESMGEK
ncbi:DUF29 family protein, partial [Chroococcus sp. FPU101]|uniref:DUF29 family protein n=1 Tax=Chroococcus sp. FPU101 TaxID=1974212 RepID=UPI0027D9A4F8